MKNTEKDYSNLIKAGSMSTEKTNPADPNEIKGKPPVTLPIIDESIKQSTKKEIAKADAQKEAEGNNYTAAENEHQENSTL